MSVHKQVSSDIPTIRMFRWCYGCKKMQWFEEGKCVNCNYELTKLGGV